MSDSVAIAEALRPVIREELERALSRQGPELLTTEQAAEELGLTPKTVRAMAKDGRLAGVRRGRRWVIRRADLAKEPPTPATVLLHTLDDGH